MSAASVESEGSGAAGAAATVQARAVVIGAVTAIAVQPVAVFAWLFAMAAGSAVARGD